MVGRGAVTHRELAGEAGRGRGERSGQVDAIREAGNPVRVADRVPRGGRPDEAQDRRLRRSWLSLVAAFVALAALTALNLFQRNVWLAIVALGLVFVVGLAGWVHRRVISDLEDSRRLESESFQRILQGLSRSVSPDAIVDAIVEDLGMAAGADHTVVVRLRADARILEATLVSSRAGVPSSTTMLPLSDLEPDSHAGPTGTDARIAEQLAARVRGVYGLNTTLAQALATDQGVVGAIVLARRTKEEWTPSARRLLGAASVEASAALARAYSFREAEARASTDALTGLPNRRYFDEFCGLLARRRRADDAVGVLMIDIDHFKRLNDEFGHPAGDQVLRAVGVAIAGAVREGDVPARFGGEEFAVLLRNPGHDVAMEVGERVRAAVGALDLSSFGPRGVTVSVGVAVARSADQPISALVDEADHALYRAKRLGRDRVVPAA